MRNDILCRILDIYGGDSSRCKTLDDLLEAIVIAKEGSLTGKESRNELLEKIKSLV